MGDRRMHTPTAEPVTRLIFTISRRAA